MTKPKLLVIAPLYKSVPLRGYEKLLKIHIETLTSNFDVHLVTHYSQGNRVTENAPNVIKQISIRKSPTDLFYSFFIAVINVMPIQCITYCNPIFQNHIDKLCQENHYKYILCYMTRTFPVVPKRFHSKTIVLGIDPLTISYHLSARSASFLHKIAFKMERLLISKLERLIMSRARKFLLISEHDAKMQNKLFRPKIPAEVIRYGSRISGVNKALHLRDRRLLVVSGSGFYAPNVKALKYLLSDVWPEIQKTGNFQLHIVGSDIEESIQKLANQYDDVHVVGFVEDIYQTLSSAFASLCLVDLKVGIQTKVLEAMSCGTPVVTTRASACGAGVKNGQHVLVAEKPKDIAEAIYKLSNDDNLWKKISYNCYEYAKKEFDWNKCGSDILSKISV